MNAPTQPFSRSARLRDGTVILIRQITPDDKVALQEGLHRLSPESRYRRFLGGVNHLSKSQLRYFTEVDHVDHEALVAVAPGDDLVGVARYVRGAEPDVAEVAVTVSDDWQNKGVATDLLRALRERAAAAGIERFSALCLQSNRPIQELLEDLGATTRRRFPDRDLVELEIELPRADSADGLQAALRRTARGELDWRQPPMVRGASPLDDTRGAGSSSGVPSAKSLP